MNRYKKANEGIHAPEELKQTVVRQKRTSHAKWISAVAAVLVVAIVAGIVLWPGNTPVAHASGVIAEARYPDTVPIPTHDSEDWKSYNNAVDRWARADAARRKQSPEKEKLAEFYSTLLPELLGNSGSENLVCSPMNLYMALSMLAETTDGNSRAQILDLLGTDSIKSVRDTANALWVSTYQNDGETTVLPASSLWLNEDVSFVQETMDLLAENYYASSYSGEMGSKSFDAALQNWLNEQTGGLLKKYAADLAFEPETVLALVATLYFRTGWMDEFREEHNTEAVFHGTDGDSTVTFLNETTVDLFYWGDQFTAYAKPLLSGSMWFLLPDEGVSVDELLDSGTAAEFFSAQHDWEENGTYTVNFSLPKFDISSQIDLTEGLKALGITDVFDERLADFTPMTDMEDVYVGEAVHAARVTVDEKGVEAAAFTMMRMTATGAITSKDEVDFVLDRPFLFAITSDTGHLLFVGVVNQV